MSYLSLNLSLPARYTGLSRYSVTSRCPILISAVVQHQTPAEDVAAAAVVVVNAVAATSRDNIGVVTGFTQPPVVARTPGKRVVAVATHQRVGSRPAN